MTSNIESALPLDSCRTCPPGTSNSNWDIIWGPIRDGDVDEERPLYEVLGLTPSPLRRIEQVGFCTNAAVAYNNAMHSRVFIFKISTLDANMGNRSFESPTTDQHYQERVVRMRGKIGMKSDEWKLNSV